MEAANQIIPALLGVAVLLPLLSFWLIFAVGRWMGKAGEYAAYVASAAIVSGFVLSVISAALWFSTRPDQSHAGEAGAEVAAHAHDDSEHESHEHADHGDPAHDHDAAADHAGAGHEGADHEGSDHAGGGHHANPWHAPITGNWYTLAEMGHLRLTIGYYVDSLTVLMFCMVTLIA
ncbi:MAG: hypothetical protein KDA41_09595, partial [Planctomycetales bacterium]|nr:hypothetical protein [Planctomycetales bacterium]